jgi:dihydropteroate synthase
MGVVNVTPDSFSDGGEHYSPDAAVEHALRLLDDGADLLDIGGESTRPGTKVGTQDASVDAAEELRRILPVITEIKVQRPQAVISVDTYKAAVAEAAVAAGAHIVNDVSGLQWDPAMARTIANLNCGLVLMHTRGRPDEWAALQQVTDLATLVKRELRERAEKAVMAGIKRDRIVLDPGFGFGKRGVENFPLLRRLQEFHELRFPLVVGVSRKSFIAQALAVNGGQPPVADRTFGSLGAEVAAALKGAHIIRTHNVKACKDALRLADIAA